MKLLLSALGLTVIAALVYLMVGRPDAQISATEGRDLETESRTPHQLRTPHLVRNLIDPSKHLEEQIEAIRALPSDLTEAEYAALIDLLHQSAPAAQRPHTWSTLQNEIMEVLRSTRFNYEGYGTAMTDLLLSKEANPIMRDYAAQHLVIYLADRSPAAETSQAELASTLSPEQIDKSLTALISVLDGDRESHQQVTGTTLMALCDLNTKRPHLLDPHRSVLSQAVQTLLDLERPASLSNRISAIQAAGRLRLIETLPKIREFAQSETRPSSLKLSSIAALGYFADPADHTLLQELALSQSPLRFAAQTALKNYSH